MLLRLWERKEGWKPEGSYDDDDDHMYHPESIIIYYFSHPHQITRHTGQSIKISKRDYYCDMDKCIYLINSPLFFENGEKHPSNIARCRSLGKLRRQNFFIIIKREFYQFIITLQHLLLSIQVECQVNLKYKENLDEKDE